MMAATAMIVTRTNRCRLKIIITDYALPAS
jgi:hypothetical protein